MIMLGSFYFPHRGDRELPCFAPDHSSGMATYFISSPSLDLGSFAAYIPSSAEVHIPLFSPDSTVLLDMYSSSNAVIWNNEPLSF